MYTLGDLVTLKQRRGASPPVTVGRRDTVREAVRVMMAERYSQLPVLSEDASRVEGVISNESIVRALYHLHDPAGQRRRPAQDPLGLSVSQCTGEKALYSADTDMLGIGEQLARSTYLLVEEGGSLVDILTHADLVDVFRQLAAHFLMIGSIEQSLRSLIRSAFPTDPDLQEAINGALHHRRDEIPQSLEEMTIDDYRHIIMSKKNWVRFEERLYDRNATQSRLIKLRDLRNDLFHFRLNTLTDDQKDFLLGTVRWLERLGNGGDDVRQPQPREDS